MIRVLFVIFGAGLVLAAVCFGGAAALGGRDIAENGWTLPADWIFDSRTGELRVDRAAGAAMTRDLAWAGAESLEIHVPADIVFTQSDTPSLVVTGPESEVANLVVEGGRITRPEDSLRFGDRAGLTIAVSGPAVRRFELHGSQDLRIENYDQDVLAVAIHGSGEVEARGRTRELELEIHGSGEADLRGLETEDARVRIAGSGEAEVAPRGHADITLHGSGDVTLVTRPARLTQRIHGSGDIRQAG